MLLLNKKWFLNSMIALALISLLIMGFIAFRRIQTERSYEQLADIKAEQEKNASDVQATDPPDTAIDATEIQYPYIANDNAKWLAINADYFGWLHISGTNIDYPYVRSHDNKDYLTLDLSGNYSDAGTLFMDYRNLGNFNDQHTVIYGHYMKNKTMFHNLTLYHKQEFYEQHPLIELSGLYDTQTYEIFSVYEISADDYAFTLAFEPSESYQNYLDELAQRSLVSTKVKLDPNQKLLTLVTCSYGVGNGRTIVHAIGQ